MLIRREPALLDPTVGEGIAAAGRRLGPISTWALRFGPYAVEDLRGAVGRKVRGAEV